MSGTYSDLFTWSHPFDEHVVLHSDGAASVLVEWAGFDTDLLTAEDKVGLWRGLYRAFAILETDWCVEWHLWREHSDVAVNAYRGQPLVRGEDFGHYVRGEIADFIAPKILVNSVGVVVTLLPGSRRISLKRALRAQSERALALLEAVQRLRMQLPGARLADVSTYSRRVWQGGTARPLAGAGPAAVDPRMGLNEQWVHLGPEDLLRTPFDRDIMLLHLYPDAEPGWAQAIAALPLCLHLCQIVKPLPRRAAIARTERAQQLAQGLARKSHGGGVAGTATALSTFLAFVEQHQLSLFQNAFIVHLYGTEAERRNPRRSLCDRVEGQGGQVRQNAWLRLPYFRVALPGQGYLCPVYRPDHLWQVANMTPVQVFATGDSDPDSLRLGRRGQPVGLSVRHRAVQHSFTIAMTGGGKGVDKATMIAETYPLGLDWYVIEIGETYRWVIEAYGGTYLAIDPGVTSVNPLPPYPRAAGALPAEQALATVRALAFLLTDGRVDLTVHESAVAQAALQGLYVAPVAGRAGPSMAELPDALRALRPQVAEQQPAATHMAANLESFLETAEGRVFCAPDSVHISRGLCGVDLKLVDQASPKLLKFYLVFLSLKFGHIALADKTPTRVLLDELHKFVAHAPDVVGRLVAELARMGRKECASIDLVTQGLGEIDAIDKEVVNAMAIKQLLYRNDQWDEVARRLEMPAGALARWKKFSYPVADAPRAALRAQDGSYHHLWLAFPQALVDLADSSGWALETKSVLGRMTRDPRKRLELLAAARAKRA